MSVGVNVEKLTASAGSAIFMLSAAIAPGMLIFYLRDPEGFNKIETFKAIYLSLAITSPVISINIFITGIFFKLFSNGKRHNEEEFHGMTVPSLIVTIASSVSMLPFYRIVSNTIYQGIKYTRRDALCTIYKWEGIAIIVLFVFFILFKILKARK